MKRGDKRTVILLATILIALLIISYMLKYMLPNPLGGLP